MPKKAQTLESCQDFMGTTLKVGDYIARSNSGQMFLGEIVRIKLRKSKQWSISKGAFEETAPFVVCEVSNLLYPSSVKSTVRPENIVYVGSERALIYKLTL